MDSVSQIELNQYIDNFYLSMFLKNVKNEFDLKDLTVEENQIIIKFDSELININNLVDFIYFYFMENQILINLINKETLKIIF